ncbi:hypothetical protein, partial [Methanohalobium sp.]|uniref:hypothetical protein n=1 Tax=Methanohalobium sp. TaxID=2837493 RepID=UPI0025FF528F
GYQDLTIPNIYCSIYDSDEGKRIGSLEDTVIEGQMVKPTYIKQEVKGKINGQKQVKGKVITKKIKGTVHPTKTVKGKIYQP